MSVVQDLDDDGELDIFQEPPGYFAPEKPHTFDKYTFEDGQELTLRLVGHSPLWGHLVWNASRITTDFILKNAKDLVHNKAVLELGAGAGLPSIAAATTYGGATKVVVTDYPDAELLENLKFNIVQAKPFLRNTDPPQIVAEGFLWGANIEKLTKHLPDSAADSAHGARFDTIILSDLLFNHSEHTKLANTLRMALKRTKHARAIVFFTPHRPWLLEKDLAFFDVITTRSEPAGGNHAESEADVSTGCLASRKILETLMDKVMFEEDRGDETLRRTVFGHEIFWADLQ